MGAAPPRGGGGGGGRGAAAPGHVFAKTAVLWRRSVAIIFLSPWINGPPPPPPFCTLFLLISTSKYLSKSLSKCPLSSQPLLTVPAAYNPDDVSGGRGEGEGGGEGGGEWEGEGGGELGRENFRLATFGLRYSSLIFIITASFHSSGLQFYPHSQYKSQCPIHAFAYRLMFCNNQFGHFLMLEKRKKNWNRLPVLEHQMYSTVHIQCIYTVF
jgi:hypothetical protein